ncbi:MAG TPA: hypothetical protein VMT16_12605 [Thermoanaerobaculia bacterium]|nr:hypothetical protein [Thermoanaerobaculia bacterium]
MVGAALLFSLFTVIATAGGAAIARHFLGRRQAVVTALLIAAFFAALWVALRLWVFPLFAAP